MESKETIFIKRYANRKLYNTNESSYITLDEVAKMVKDGVDLRIVDHKSKKDITSVILAQIIFEKEKKHKNLPSQTLRHIIQSGGEAINEFFKRRVNIGQIREEAEKTVEVLEKLFSKSSFSREDGAKLVRELLQNSQRNLEDMQRRIDERIKALMGPVANFGLLRKEVDALKTQIDLLEEKIENLERLLSEDRDAEG